MGRPLIPPLAFTSSMASLVATRLSRPAGRDGPVSELAKAMQIGVGRLQTMAAQATARSRTAPMTPAAMTRERDFGLKILPLLLDGRDVTGRSYDLASDRALSSLKTLVGNRRV